MRILMISDVYFPRVNGVSTSIQTFAREFTDKGHEVTLIAPEYGPDAGSWESGACHSSDDPHAGGNCLAPDGVEIVRIPSRYLPLDPEDRILRPSLESLTIELGLREHVLFVGYLSREGALEDCYCAGDAFVFASRTETQGLVLIEAMALGVPVVSTAVMGTKEVLEGGRGSLIAADDEADFASKAMRLLCDAELRATLREQARACAGTWSASALADRMLELYQAVTGMNRTRAGRPCRSPRNAWRTPGQAYLRSKR